MEPFLGQIQPFGFNFAPRGWALCQGQLLPISANTALFSLLGTIYGGDGRTTFALPDLRGRSMINFGQGAGLSNYSIGHRAGQETVTLNTSQIPSHNHAAAFKLGNGLANNSSGAGNRLAGNTGGTSIYNSGAANDNLANDVIGVGDTGGNQSHTNLSPYLAINISICTVGLYPSRN